MQANSALLQKYNRPVPRYTSYPTIPFWKDQLDIPRWQQQLQDRFAECNHTDGISLYIHLPFCESLCIYCGCNKKISTNHSLEDEYLQAVAKEWAMYRQIMGQRPVIREIHLGGGTPTWFSPASLRQLVNGLLDDAVIHPDHSFSIEGHPNNTTREHLDTLYTLGFRRISYGVQDLNREVQEAIHRVQPFEYLRRATDNARTAGFSSVNFDLIYGLPLQTLPRLRHTIAASLTLQPDRLAFYSYAHTPWLNCSQRLIDEKDLPSPSEKVALYEAGKSWLVEKGYTNIGMDHFALENEELCVAWKGNKLHRNFMGYTTQASGMLLGLGVSAISDLGTAFAQNDKTLAGYYRSIGEGTLAVKKGYFLTEEDQVFRRHILDIACKGTTVLDPAWASVLEEWTFPRLRELAADGLVILNEEPVTPAPSTSRVTSVTLIPTGRAFLRHVCKAFDLHLLREEKNGVADLIRCGKSGLNPQINYV